MIQAVMYIALGLLIAGMLALLVTPAIWRRATRLTRQRIESSLPATLAEIQADKDQLRAEFAIDSRRLELTADRLREKTTEQTFEINQKRVEIVRLTNERNQLTATITNFEQRHAQLIADLNATTEQLSDANEKIRQGESLLATREGELSDLRNRYGAEQQLTAVLKREIAERNTEIANIRDRLADAKALGEKVTAERDGLAAALAAEQSALAAEHQRAENIDASLSRIEAERIDLMQQLERRSAEVQELVAERARERTHTEDLTALVSNIEAERIKLVSKVEKRDAEIARLEEIERRAVEAQEHAAEEFTREQARAENFSGQASRLDAERIELGTQLEKRGAEIVRLEELERRATEAREQTAEELAGERARIEELTAQASRMDAEQKELGAQLEQRNAEIERLAGLERRASEAQEQTAEELARERTRIEHLSARASRMDAEQKELSSQLEKRDTEISRLAEFEQRAAEAKELVAELAGERARREEFAERASELDAERVELGSQLDQREAEITRLKNSLAMAVSNGDLKGDGADTALPVGDNIAKAIAAAEMENAALVDRLEKLEAEHADLSSQNEELRRKLSSDFDIDAENALLRERLTGVAADIVRLTRTAPDEEATTIPDKTSLNLDEDGAAKPSDATPSLRRRPTSVPVIKRPVGGSNQSDGDKPLAEQMRAAPPTATRH